MAKYDDASWHSGGEFPSDLPADRGATHIGMFLGWAIDNELEGKLLKEEFPEQLAKFRNREATGKEVLHACCDDKLTNEDLNEVGNAFAMEYYEADLYLDDYADVFGDEVPTLFHVEDKWSNYSRIKERLDKRFEEWKARRK